MTVVLDGTTGVFGIAPTLSVDTNTNQLATAAFVINQAASANPVINGTADPGSSLRYARADHVHPTDTTRAPLASPTFTGSVSLPAPTANAHAVRRQDVVERIGTVSLAGLTAAAITIPSGFRKLNLGISPTLMASAGQNIAFQVMMNGAWVTTGSGVYFSQLVDWYSSTGFFGAAMADTPGGIVFAPGQSSTPFFMDGSIEMDDVGSGVRTAYMSIRMLGWTGSAWNSRRLDGVIYIPSTQRIEQIRVINVTGSPANFSNGHFHIEGVRA